MFELDENEMESILCGLEDCRMGRMTPFGSEKDWKKQHLMYDKTKRCLEYFRRETLKMDIEQPLQITETADKFDITVSVQGGGLSGQAGAVRLGIARALLNYSEDFRPILRRSGFLTRDPREKERRKYGLAKARKRYQFSKR